jgi:hypothetical protein
MIYLFFTSVEVHGYNIYVSTEITVVSKRPVGVCKEIGCIVNLADCAKFAEAFIRTSPFRGLSTVVAT